MSKSATFEFVVYVEHTLSAWQEWITCGTVLPQLIISSTFGLDGEKWIACLPRE